jgi:diadenosine tetraphosphate (Ap4A) HIT family hydrolase
MTFTIDERLITSSTKITELELSTLFLKNDATYPWLILVPRANNISEIYQLNSKDQKILMHEINRVSLIIKDIFKPEKINIGSLGNIVSQLHIHLIGRYSNDPTWPHGEVIKIKPPTPR